MRTRFHLRPIVASVSLLFGCKRDDPEGGPTAAIVEPSDLKSDEVVLFVPTFGTLEGGTWKLPLSAWVFEPEEDGLSRRAALKAVQEAIGAEADDATAQRVTQNMRPFMVDNERGKHIAVRLGETPAVVGTSGANGRCDNVIELTAEQASAAATGKPPVIEYEAVLREGDARHFTGWVQLLDDAGTSVISDIDDTIKITEVHDKKALIANTFARPFRPAPGMPQLYRRWAAEGLAFHYISNSPLPLLGALTRFFTEAGFPMGSLGLKPFRWTDGEFLELLAAPESHKQDVIEGVVGKFDKRRFILVGDTGERDPEIYAAIARKFPDRIEKIYLRDPQEGGTAGIDERLATAYDGLPRELWVLFADGKEIAD